MAVTCSGRDPPPSPPPSADRTSVGPTPHFSFSLLTIVFLLLTPPPQSHAFYFSVTQYKTLISLSHSLISRVGAARHSRGDLPGAARARHLADKLHLLGGGSNIWAVGWDFAWNYALHGGVSTADIYRDGLELISVLGEAVGLDSGAERASWLIRNRNRLLGLSSNLFRRLLREFTKTGPLRETILVLQKEVAEGELLKDCLEVGAKDLDGLINLAKALFFSAGSDNREL